MKLLVFMRGSKEAISAIQATFKRQNTKCKLHHAYYWMNGQTVLNYTEISQMQR